MFNFPLSRRLLGTAAVAFAALAIAPATSFAVKYTGGEYNVRANLETTE